MGLFLVETTFIIFGDKLKPFVLNPIGLNHGKPELELVGHFHLQQLHLDVGRRPLLYLAPPLVILHHLLLQDPVGLVVVVVGQARAEEVVYVSMDVGEFVLQD